jgi:hypothetical protein
MSVQAESYRSLFSNYNVTASHFVYNGNGGTAATAGWVSGKASNAIIMLCCATLTSNSISYRIEGKITGSDRIASLDAGTMSVSKSVDTPIKVVYPTSQIRLGLKASSTVSTPLASPNKVYSGLYLRELK